MAPASVIVGRMDRTTAPTRDLLLLILTAAAGGVDAISYLGFGRVFTANMTGNLVLLGIAAGSGQLSSSLRSLIAFLGFGVGVLVGARLASGAGQEHRWSRHVTMTLSVELALLIVLASVWSLTDARPTGPELDLLIAIAAAAMGLQTAAARQVGISGVTTTYVTGTFTSLLAGIDLKGMVQPGWRRLAATLGCLVAGAAATGGLLAVAAPAAAVVPLGLVCGVVVVAVSARPPHASP
jgi:uncharacterized membrane protein YoaK (UPF0700 family)